MTEDIKIYDVPGMVKRDGAIVNTDKDALTAYTRQKNFYRSIDEYKSKVDSLETKIDYLEARVKYLEDIVTVNILSKV